MAQDNQANALPVAPAAVQPHFTLVSTLHSQQAGFIDYGTKEGQKLFELSSAVLNLDKKFDGKRNEIIIFKQALSERADFAGWTLTNNDIIIPTGVDNEIKNLIDNYGTEISTWKENNIVGQQTRAAQNNFAMYKYLSDTISDNLKYKLVTNQINCSVNGTKIVALLFKAIMNESEINTVATISAIQLLLSRLQEVINNDDISGDIFKFNRCIKEKVQDLTCRGATYSGLILNLIQAYQSVSDSDFVAYISLKETAYLNSELELSSDQLMLIAEIDYPLIGVGEYTPHNVLA